MERLTQFRARMLLTLFAALLCFFSFRLYYLQVVETENQTDNQTTFTTMTRVKAARGEILDRNGNVLVGNRASYDLVIIHYVLTSSDTANEQILQLAKLCQDMGIEYNEHFPITKTQPFTYTLDQQNSSWQGYFQKFLQNRSGGLDSDISAPLLIQKLRSSYGIPEDWSDEEARLVIGIRYELTLRNLTNLPIYVFLTDATNEQRAAILELNTPGMKVEASTVREYYTEYAAHILGYVGALSPAQWEKYKDVEGYSMDAEIGQSGFEEAFEKYLHGTDGWRIDTYAADGTLLKSRYDPEPKAGNNVEVTIDVNLQMVAEDSLERTIRELRNGWVGETEGGAVVIMDVKTGQILACGSYPTYDPAKLFEDYNEITSQPYGPLNNRALQFAYPPGSVYKMSMVVAGINDGLITSTSKIEDKGVFTTYAGFSPACLLWTHDQKTHGMVTAEYALCVSCNYYFYELADRMGLSVMDSTAKGLGLGEPTGVELDENIGYRANKETKAMLYKGDEGHWLQGDMILAGIGQSDNRFTPLQLCVYTSTLANKGTRFKATFLNRVVSTNYRSLIYENQPEIMSVMEISEDAHEAYSSGMRWVGNQHEGTASTYFIGYPIPVCCKTGTAQTGDTSAPDNGSFVCYAPQDDPQIAVAIYAEKAGTGGYLAPVARDILDVYFGVDAVGNVSTTENEVC